MEEILLVDVKCEKCKFYFTGKTDEGRFHRCENDEALVYVKNIEPNFGCKFFKKSLLWEF